MNKRLLLAVLLLVAACGGDSSPSRENPPPSRSAAAGGEVPATPRVEPPSIPPVDVVFQPDSAWTYLVKQMDFGPRVPGTSAHRLCADWMAAFLERAGGRVDRDDWVYTDSRDRRWPLENILARFGPEGGGRLLLVAHWDCRPWADEDPDPAKRDEPVPGANDAASGVAVLMEIGRCLGKVSLSRGVDILLVDGEDLGEEDASGFCQGSRRFAWKGVSLYRRGIVLDMVGDADLRLPVEAFSVSRAPEVVDWIWGRARELGSTVFSPQVGHAVFDDHMPLLDAGLPAADIIDFDYPPWHTTADDLDAVSPRSLYEVGRVVLSLALRP